MDNSFPHYSKKEYLELNSRYSFFMTVTDLCFMFGVNNKFGIIMQKLGLIMQYTYFL